MTTATSTDTRTQTRHILNVGVKAGDALKAWTLHTAGQPTTHPIDALDNVTSAARRALRAIGTNPDDAVDAVCAKVCDRFGFERADLQLTAQRAARYFDAANGTSPDEMDMRVGKVLEEAGEAWGAWAAYRHQNPRKPQGPLSDVVAELADVILTAATAAVSIEGR